MKIFPLQKPIQNIKSDCYTRDTNINGRSQKHEQARKYNTSKGTQYFPTTNSNEKEFCEMPKKHTQNNDIKAAQGDIREQR